MVQSYYGNRKGQNIFVLMNMDGFTDVRGQ